MRKKDTGFFVDVLNFEFTRESENMAANFSVDTSQFDTLQRNVERLSNEAEKVINEALIVNVSPVLEKSILSLMPISNRNKNTLNCTSR